MARTPRSVEEAIARFDEYSARLDGHVPTASSAQRRYYGRAMGGIVKRVATMGMAIGLLIVATIGFGLIVGPIGWTGLFIVALATLAILLFFSFLPGEPKRVAYNEQLPRAPSSASSNRCWCAGGALCRRRRPSGRTRSAPSFHCSNRASPRSIRSTRSPRTPGG